MSAGKLRDRRGGRLPAGVVINARWTPKRGRRLPSVQVKQIYRVDHAVLTLGDDGARRVLSYGELRADWRPPRP